MLHKHDLVVSAIQMQDPEGAALAMRQHLREGCCLMT